MWYIMQYTISAMDQFVPFRFQLLIKSLWIYLWPTGQLNAQFLVLFREIFPHFFCGERKNRRHNLFIVSKVTVKSMAEAPNDAYVSENVKDLDVVIAPAEES